MADINPAVSALENLWLITVAVTLLVNRRSPQPQPVIATEASLNGEFAEVRPMSELLR